MFSKTLPDLSARCLLNLVQMKARSITSCQKSMVCSCKKMLAMEIKLYTFVTFRIIIISYLLTIKNIKQNNIK